MMIRRILSIPFNRGVSLSKLCRGNVGRFVSNGLTGCVLRVSQQFGSGKFSTEEFIDIGDAQNDGNLLKEKGFGSLTICPTPLGNLGDMSVRQYQSLLSADVIACEDTRVTGMLLQLMRRKKLHETLEDTFGAENLGELKEDQSNRKQDDLINEEDDTHLLENDAIDTSTSTRLTREERIHLKICELRNKARQVLKDEDTLHFYNHQKGDDQDDPAADPSYGLEDEFIRFLKAKILQSKKRKGRGILISYHKYNEENRLTKLIKIMRYGLNIVLVSDAGTPTISDPGYKIVNKCLENNIRVEALPGPSSCIVALSKSGYAADRFHFEGYIAKVQSEREESLQRMKKSELTTVAFESVNRLFKTLLSIEKVIQLYVEWSQYFTLINEIFGEKQQIFLCFEMTKLHEKYYRGETRELYELLNDPEKIKSSHLKGELTIVIPPYHPQYNKELLEDQFRKNKQKYYHMEWEDEQDQKLVQIEPKVLATILNETLETTDQDLANLLSQILRISRTRAMSLVGFTKHGEKKTRNWDAFIHNYTEEVKRKEKRSKHRNQEHSETEQN